MRGESLLCMRGKVVVVVGCVLCVIDDRRDLAARRAVYCRLTWNDGISRPRTDGRLCSVIDWLAFP